MNRLIFTIVAGITIFITNDLFAKGVMQGDCLFPRHFSIMGPPNTHIMKVQIDKSENNNLRVSNIKSNGFDLALLNEQNCSGGTIDLIVGTDKENFCEITMVNSSNRIKSRFLSCRNDFYTQYFDYEITEANISLVFYQH
ncbi:MAG: hypothetical protein EPN84_07565 [Legionella sp.]|nr:MAG: hypothetical protein EPN84_07565 [Legionella sp.]